MSATSGAQSGEEAEHVHYGNGQSIPIAYTNSD
jgi:hypothetical protein